MNLIPGDELKFMQRLREGAVLSLMIQSINHGAGQRADIEYPKDCLPESGLNPIDVDPEKGDHAALGRALAALSKFVDQIPLRRPWADDMAAAPRP